MLTYTVLWVLFSYVHYFGPKKYLGTSDFCNKHNMLNIFAISKYGNCLHHVLRSGMHLVYVYNLPDMIWLSFEWKQGVQILSATTSIYCIILSLIYILITINSHKPAVTCHRYRDGYTRGPKMATCQDTHTRATGYGFLQVRVRVQPKVPAGYLWCSLDIIILRYQEDLDK